MPNSPYVRHQAALPARCNRRNHQSSGSRDNLLAAATEPPALDCSSSQKGSPADSAARRFAPTSRIGCPVLDLVLSALHSGFVAVDDVAFSSRSRIKFSNGCKCSAHWITQRAKVWRDISIPWRPSTFSKRCSGRPSTYLVVSSIARTLGLSMLFQSIERACPL